MAIQFQDSIHVNNGSLVATNFIAVKGNSNPDISEFNNPASTSVNLGTYLDQYAFIDLSSSASGGGWIDFSKADGSDYSGRIRYQNNTDELQVFTSGRLVTTIKSDGVGSGSWGHAKIYMSNRWGGGGTHYPTIGSEDGSAGSLIMLDNPHVPWSTENSASSSYDGRAGLRLERPDKNGWWDAGLAGDFYHIYRGGTGELLKLTSTGNLTVSGSVSATGGNSGQWNTAYGWGNHASAGYQPSGTYADGTTYQTYGTGNNGWLMPDYNNNTSNFMRMYYDDGSREFRMYSYHGAAGEAKIALYDGGSFNTLSSTNIAEFKTAYAWGNHAGLYDAAGAADAVNTRIDEEVFPAIPTNNNQLTNGAGYLTIGQLVQSQSVWSNATRFKSEGDIGFSGAGNHSLQVISDNGNDAFMAFHISGDHAVYFGLENATNRLYTGGWSLGTAKHQIWDTRDFTSTNVSNWNTAYGWGNHAGLYDGAGAADAVNVRIDEEILPAIDTKVSKAGDQVTGALSVGGSAAYDSANLALDVQGDVGIWGNSKIYFKITSDNYNTWSTSQYADGSTHKFNAQAFSFTNEGYSASVFMNINSSGVGMSRNLVLGNEVYGNLNAYANWGARLFFNGSNSDAETNYYIGTNGEDYGGNYSKLDLRWHTGIRMGAQPSYGGIRFYDTEDLGTRIMSIGETDSNIRIDNNLWIGGAGGWITDLLNGKLGATAKAVSANLIVSTAASGSVLMKHNNSEANAWIFQEAAPNWGLYWFNTGSQSGQSIGNRYTTVGAEMFGFKDGNSQSAIQAPQGWDGVDANTHYQWMISNYTGSAYFNNDVESRTGFYVNGNKVATESYAAGAADAVNVRIDEEVFPAIDAAVSNLVDSAPSALNTLNELAAALGDDVNFSTTVTNSLASKLSTTGKAADSNLFDGIDSVNFVYGNANGTNDSVTTDADGLNKTGYYTSSAFTTRPSSVANWMYIEHIKLYNSNTRYQKQIGYDTYDNRMWVRTKNDNTWSGWSQIWTSDVFANNSSDWNTAYGWGNHAGLYDGIGSADAVNVRIDEEVLPLIETKADASHTHDYLPLSGGTITGDLSIANSRALNLFSEGTDAFVNIDARDNGEGARLHKYNRNAANTSYLPYYENWYDGNSYHSIGIEADKWRFSDSVVINQNLQVGDGMWVNGNNQAVYNNYNENLRLPPAGNDVSVIAFRATGEGGVPSSSILGYSNRHETRIDGTWRQRIYAGSTEINNDLKVYGSYTEVGNGIGSVSNDGSWNARLNVAGSSHARLDVKSVSDGIITSMYAHTGQGVGKVGTMSNHPAVLMAGGTSHVIVGTDGSLSPVIDRTQLLGLDSNRWQIVFCEILDSAGLHEKNLQNPKGEKQVGEYETGTVLVWKGGKNIPCTEPADHMRMGIAVKDVSSPLVQGAEPVLCTGEVNEGDYLVTSSVEGHAAAISPQYMRQHGLYDCVIGKALESAEGKSHLVKTWVNI